MKMNRRIMPPADLIGRSFTYDPISGNFFYARNFRHFRCGDLAGLKHPAGYIQIFVGGQRFLAHRLAWWIVNGPIPDRMEIDHIDGNKMNNKIENLRLATIAQQNYNKRVHRNCISGLKGAHSSKRRASFAKPWHSQVVVAGNFIFLGHFATAQEAHEAYVAATKEYCGGYARVA